MKLETLYKRTKTGAVQYWQVETQADTILGFASIIKQSGQLNTESPIYHKEHVDSGKQGRTTLEQAEFQAESDWKKKHDEGYKTVQDLGITVSGDLMHWTFNYVNYISKADALQTALPKFNTDASGNVKPMLATDWNKIKKVEFPCFCEPKLDGVRCLMLVSGEEGPDIKFLSRSGKEYSSLSHIADEVITAWDLKGNINSGFILDGEIYSDELSFQEIVSAVKAYKEDSLKLKFRAYDIVSGYNQRQRKLQLSQVINKLDSDLIQILDWTTVLNKEDVKIHHDVYVQKGYEGAILRMYEGKYAQGQRSRELLKVKEFDETEFAFKNFEFGQRGVEDLIAVCWNKEGVEFRAKMVGTLKQKTELYSNDGLEGKSLTVKHFGFTTEGLPRFPIGKAFRNYE